MPTYFLPLDSDTARRARLHSTLRHLTPALMGLPPEGLVSYADEYFPMAVAALKHTHLDPTVHMQFFAKHKGVVAGTSEALAALRAMLPDQTDAVHAWSLADGDLVEPRETLLTLTAPYSFIAAAETIIDGILADRSLVATNASRVATAANGKPVIFMGARHAAWSRQSGDGYAALVGGVQSLSTRAGYAWVAPETRAAGTMPHALIACTGGDAVAATLAMIASLRAQGLDGVCPVTLVDYNNDSVIDAIRVARAVRSVYGEGVLHGVRLDTSEAMTDKTILRHSSYGNDRSTGVTPLLVRLVREALDDEGFPAVKIVVSGGFNARKIAHFEAHQIPVDYYGVGSSILGHNAGETDGMLSSFDVTGDIVAVDGREQHKAGRRRRENSRLLQVDWSEGRPEEK